MSKVVKQNVILGGQEIKAGTPESDIPDEVKKPASKFLIDEKKYKSAEQSSEVIDAKVNARIVELEEENATAREYAEANEQFLSEANSTIAGLTSDLETANKRADDAEANVVELEEAAKAAKKK